MLEREKVKGSLYDLELLTILIEECSEVIQAATKIQRYGWDSEYNGKSSQDSLEKELGDLQCMINLLHENDRVSFTTMDNYCEDKRNKLRKWSNLFEYE